MTPHPPPEKDATPKPPAPPAPVFDPDDPQPIAKLWNRPVWELATIPQPDSDPEKYEITDEEKERHKIFSLLLLTILVDNFNGNKRGPYGDYPWREKQKNGGLFEGGTYFGHNIAGVAVNDLGDIVDFDFNHNDLFGSSMEHAESRLVRRIFSLTELQNLNHTLEIQHGIQQTRRIEEEERAKQLASGDKFLHHGPVVSKVVFQGSSYYNILSNATVYTSLESCAQCAGIMALAQVKQLVYLQQDPGETLVAQVLHNLTRGALKAPIPIAANRLRSDTPGKKFEFGYFDQLDAAYKKFYMALKNDKAASPFYKDPEGNEDRSPAISSFLCTDLARDIFTAGKAEFRNPGFLQYSGYRPTANAKSNFEVWQNALVFADYVKQSGFRGTRHRA